MYILWALIPNFENQRQFVKYLEKSDRCSKECWLCPTELYPKLGDIIKFPAWIWTKGGLLDSGICYSVMHGSAGPTRLGESGEMADIQILQ